MARKILTSMVVLLFLTVACKPDRHSTAVLPANTPHPLISLTPTATPVPVWVNITIDQSDKRQTIGQIGGGNFIHYFGGTTSATEPISEMNIAILQPRFARVSMELQEWEPVNDNGNSSSMDPSAFYDDQHNRATFELMKMFKGRGVVLTASIWRVPDWLVENPQDESSRIIARSLIPEAVESISAWLLHARDQYGVEVNYVSFNEANLGVTVYLSPEDYVEIIRQGGERFAELGLTTKWLLGDCSSTRGCLDYVKPIWAAVDIHPYIGPLAFHSWDGVNVSDITLTDLGEWAADQGLDVHCTESGWDAQLWQRPDEFSDWTNARQLAVSYNRVIKMSRATAFYYWEMMGTDYQLNNGHQAYPVMKILQQLNDAFPPGTQIIGTSPNNSTVYWVAGKRPSGDISIHVVSNTVAEKARVTGLPDGIYDLTISTRVEMLKPVQAFNVTDGSLLFDLPALSVALLETQR